MIHDWRKLSTHGGPYLWFELSQCPLCGLIKEVYTNKTEGGHPRISYFLQGRVVSETECSSPLKAQLKLLREVAVAAKAFYEANDALEASPSVHSPNLPPYFQALGTLSNLFDDPDVLSLLETKHCIWEVAWRGPCHEPCVEGTLCNAHKGNICVSCGKDANQECCATVGPFVCGANLCSNCKHEYNGSPIHKACQ